MHENITGIVIRFCFYLLAITCYSTEPARKVVVAADGSGNFTNIAEAIASIKDATPASPVDIIIKPGAYNETITTRDWINLIGEDREKCVISYDCGTEKDVHKYHTIWATSNTKIKNLTLIGQTVKYVIHSDGGRDFVLTIENCILRREYPTAKAKGYGAAFGIGLHANQHIVMKDCLIDAILPIYMHNWNNQKSSCSMTLEKCSLKGQDYALGIYLLGSKQRDFFVIHDSTLNGAKGSINYVNQRDVKGTNWHGDNEMALTGSGNTLVGITGAEMKDDTNNRLSGVELSRQTTPNVLTHSSEDIEENYGTAPDNVRKSKIWQPAAAPGRYCLKTDMTNDALVLTCPPADENPDSFGSAGGPSGAEVNMPVLLEIRMKCSFVPNGMVQLYYCNQPDGWLMQWKTNRVEDAFNPQSFLPVDTAAWQTYRFMARNKDDVRLLVNGVPGDGISLKRGNHSADYFQLRVCGHGSRIEIDRTKISGTLPTK